MTVWRSVLINRYLWFPAVVLVSTLFAFGASAQPTTEPRIHFVYMGGSDCPPCVYWRATELPKLKEKEIFKSIRFSYVVKLIKSTVPPSFFLPDEVKPLKEKLDTANNNTGGSPQVAVFVNGQVFDYYWGTRTADDVEQMLIAIKTGSPYPYERCIKLARFGKCAVNG